MKLEPINLTGTGKRSSSLFGVCGLNQDPHASDKEVGRVRRLYVSPSVRQFGIGQMLMDSVIAEAKNYYQMLVLKTDNPVADLFYQSIGFSVKVDSENDTHFVKLSLSSNGELQSNYALFLYVYTYKP